MRIISWERIKGEWEGDDGEAKWKNIIGDHGKDWWKGSKEIGKGKMDKHQWGL